MSRGPEQFRLAVASFDDPLSLAGAIRKLRGDGIGADQLCIIGSAQALDEVGRAVRSQTSQDGHDSVVGALGTWPQPAGGREMRASEGPLRDCLIKLHEHGPRARAEGNAPRLDIADHVRDDTVTLIVRSLSPAQQSATTRTLLSRSVHSVKTYEFTFGGDGDADEPSQNGGGH